MAIVKFGVVVVGARGTIGGMKFSANGAGPYAAQWSKGSNPSTPAQSEQRIRISTLASSWRSLPQAQRDDWDDYADDPAQEKTNSLGETYFVSGFNWYVALNQNRIAAGAGVRDDAPTLARPLAAVIDSATLTLAPSPGTALIDYSVSDPNPLKTHIVWVSLVNSQGIVFIPKQMPFMKGAIPGVPLEIDITTELIAKFGTVSLGQRLLVRSAIQDVEGRRGPEDTVITDAV